MEDKPVPKLSTNFGVFGTGTSINIQPDNSNVFGGQLNDPPAQTTGFGTSIFGSATSQASSSTPFVFASGQAHGSPSFLSKPQTGGFSFGKTEGISPASAGFTFGATEQISPDNQRQVPQNEKISFGASANAPASNDGTNDMPNKEEIKNDEEAASTNESTESKTQEPLIDGHSDGAVEKKLEGLDDSEEKDEDNSSSIRCAMCEGNMSDPFMLACFHIFCDRCIAELQKTSSLCPICQTAINIAPITMSDLLPGATNTDPDKLAKLTCGNCNQLSPTWRCSDCKDNFCETCKSNHDGFKLFRNHKWQMLDDRSKLILDEIVFCHKHASKPAEFHCRECNELLCLLCNGTLHKNHTAETVDDALCRIIEEVNAHKGKIANSTSAIVAEIGTTKAIHNDLELQYSSMEARIDKSFDDCMKMLEQEHKIAKSTLLGIKAKHFEEILVHTKALEFRANGQKSIVKWVDKSLSSAMSASLLDSLQSGLRDNLAVFSNAKAPNRAFSTAPKALLTTHNQASSFDACKVSPASISSRIIDISTALRTINTLPYSRSQQVGITFAPGKLTHIDNMIWVIESTTQGSNSRHPFNLSQPCSNTTRITKTWLTDQHQQNIKHIQVENMTVNAIIEHERQLIVASPTGLYITDMDFQNRFEMITGHFVDVCVDGNTIYALNNNASILTVITPNDNLKDVTEECKNKKFENRSILLQTNSTSYYNSILVTDRYVYVGLFQSNRIMKIEKKSIRQQLATAKATQHGNIQINEYLMLGDVQGNPPTQAPGKLSNPLICGADPEGTLLIADSGHKRFQSLTEEGVWKVLQVKGTGKMQFQPLNAIMFKDHFVVLQKNGVTWWTVQ